MATLNVTFAFASDAQGFTANAGAQSTLTWNGTQGNPVGSLQASASGSNVSNSNSWTLATTFEALGVPAGSTITGITGASMQSMCTAYGGAQSTAGNVTLSDGATVATLAAARSFTATDASWQTSSGTDLTGLSLASADSITIAIKNALATAHGGGNTVTLLQDQLGLTVTYTAGAIGATLNATVADAALAAAGEAPTAATAGVTLAAATLAGTAAAPAGAALNAALGAAALAAAGTATGPIDAALAATLGDATAAAAGAAVVAASAASAAAGATMTAAGSIAVAAALGTTLDPATPAAAGTTGNDLAASLSVTLAGALLAAVASSRIIAPIGVGTAASYARQASAGSGLDTLADPGSSNPPIIFEPPSGLSGGDLEVWIIASGGADWGGCQVWVSSDGNTYALAGTIYRGGRQGILTADLASGADPDAADTLSVDLTQSQGQMLSGTQADADSYVTLCYCDGELVSYETATLTASYKYDLTYLRRGVYGTPIGAHSSGAPFARFGPNDPSLFRYRYPASFVGQTIQVKLPAFNIFGQGLQDLSGLTPTGYTLTGDGAVAAPAYVSGSFAGSPGGGQVIERYIFATPVTFPAGLAGSYGTAGTAATADASFTIAKNGTAVGAMAFAAGAAEAAFTMAAAAGFAGGDVLTITAPATPDATLANLAWTLSGTQ
jgi:hypothetical protein